MALYAARTFLSVFQHLGRAKHIWGKDCALFFKKSGKLCRDAQFGRLYYTIWASPQFGRLYTIWASLQFGRLCMGNVSLPQYTVEQLKGLTNGYGGEGSPFTDFISPLSVVGQCKFPIMRIFLPLYN